MDVGRAAREMVTGLTNLLHRNLFITDERYNLLVQAIPAQSMDICDIITEDMKKHGDFVRGLVDRNFISKDESKELVKIVKDMSWTVGEDVSPVDGAAEDSRDHPALLQVLSTLVFIHDMWSELVKTSEIKE